MKHNSYWGIVAADLWAVNDTILVINNYKDEFVWSYVHTG